MTPALTTPSYGVTLTSNQAELSSCDRDAVIALFQSAGLLLFRGFSVTPQQFKAFTEQFSTSFMPYIGGAIPRDTINGDQTFLTVTGSKIGYAVPLHGEMYYMEHRPKVVWFYCEMPPLSQGETTVCDGIEVFKQLSPTTQALLRTKRLKYIRVYPKHVWQQMYQTENLQVVAQVCQANAIEFYYDAATQSLRTESVRPAVFSYRDGQEVFINNMLPLLAGVMGETKSSVQFEDDSEIPAAVHAEVKAVSDQLTLPIQWQQGDVLMIDNTRFLHGRRAYSDSQRNIYVRLCDAVS